MVARVAGPKLGGAVYVLPNLITTGNLFFGFFSIVNALQGQMIWAATSILLATVFDVLDGRVARLTGGTSEFGVQYDSLCDLVSFGVAPALLMYQGGLAHYGRLGWIICFLFLACGALRLARFNVQSAIGKAAGDFTGLPIPMAAAVVASYELASIHLQSKPFSAELLIIIGNALTHEDINVAFFFIAGIGLALAMVSSVTYRSHKALKIIGIKPFKLLVIFVAVVAFIAFQPEIFGFVFFMMYALSGPVEWLFGGKKTVGEEEIFEIEEEESESRTSDR
ncbi:MAG: CDP-diacylglycerol--serine O-phosphatidyltransferase [Oligoflexales bacterium]|nr:CDP-diacylglycerol--serine O-phosphatidyltransferase [Oligoflexales bacterium]